MLTEWILVCALTAVDAIAVRVLMHEIADKFN